MSPKAIRKKKKVITGGKKRGNHRNHLVLTSAQPPCGKEGADGVEDCNVLSSAPSARPNSGKTGGSTVRANSKKSLRSKAAGKRRRILQSGFRKGQETQENARPQGGKKVKRKLKRSVSQAAKVPEQSRHSKEASANCHANHCPSGQEGQDSSPSKEKLELVGDTPRHGAASDAHKRRKKKQAKEPSTKCATDVNTEEQKATVQTEASESHMHDTSQCLKVCAANLPWWFDKARIEKHFRRIGDVSHIWLLYDKWGESRGVAFITFSDKASVKAALQCDGRNVGGNVIRVNLALDKNKEEVNTKQKGPGKGWAGGGAWADTSGSSVNSANGKAKGKGAKGAKGAREPAILALPGRPEGSLGLMARGLSYDATEDDLKELFSQCGSGPTRVRVLMDKSGWSKGKAFIDFADETAVEKAMKFHDTLLKGRPLRLEYTRAASEKAGDAT